jgi:hypothetical protein
LLASLGQAADYFKQSSLSRDSFREVERNVSILFDKAGQDVMQYIRQRNHMTDAGYANEKAAGYGKVDLDKHPYCLIMEALEHGRELVLARQKLARHIVAPEVAAPAPTFSNPLFADGGKSAIVGDTADGVMGFLGKGHKPTPKLEEKAWLDLEDPKHQNELRAADTQAMLTDFLANDDVIASHDPDEVFKHYNEISRVNPSAADKPAIMRPLLRKALSGGLESFEANEMARNENTMNKSRHITPRSQGLLDAPESVLG